MLEEPVYEWDVGWGVHLLSKIAESVSVCLNETRATLERASKG